MAPRGVGDRTNLSWGLGHPSFARVELTKKASPGNRRPFGLADSQACLSGEEDTCTNRPRIRLGVLSEAKKGGGSASATQAYHCSSYFSRTRFAVHRFWQASVLVGHKIVVHGGWNGSNHCYEDLWVFDTDSFAWMQPRTGGLPPTARCVSGVHCRECRQDKSSLCVEANKVRQNRRGKYGCDAPMGKKKNRVVTPVLVEETTRSTNSTLLYCYFNHEQGLLPGLSLFYLLQLLRAGMGTSWCFFLMGEYCCLAAPP